MLRSFIITLVAIIIFAIPTMATVIHVPSDYLTIQAGINASINGDTVLVAPGTYSESIRFGGKKIVLKSESGASTTIIQPPQHRTIIISLTNGEDTTTIIQGFTIRGAVDTYAINVANAGVTLVENIVRDNTSPYSGLTHGSALRASNSTINIRSNSFIADTVTHLPGSGTLTFESTVASITGNIFRDNYNNLWASSISSFESSMIVDSNYFYNNFGYGAGAIGMTYNQKTIIKNNIFVFYNLCF